MKPFDAFTQLISRILFMDRWRREPYNKPGEVVKSMSPEAREALSQLKSDDVDEKVRVEDYWMMGDDWEAKRKMLELEKKLGFQPPPRKKYEDH